MKATDGRIRALTFLDKPNAFAMPNGFVPRPFALMPNNYSITSDMLGMMEAKGFIERRTPPDRVRTIYVWRITPKGREWLMEARATDAYSRSMSSDSTEAK